MMHHHHQSFPQGSPITPDSTFDETMDYVEDSSVRLLDLLSWWNRLDLHEFAPGFSGVSKRRLYLRDMAEVRHGGKAYYSLGGDERKKFSNVFLRLERKTQQLFIGACSMCLQQNRFMRHEDVLAIVHQERGKRDCLYEQQERPSKRQRSSLHPSYYGVHCS